MVGPNYCDILMAADGVSGRDYISDHELHVDIHGQELGREKGVFRQILSVWRTWVVLITPLVLLPIPILYPSRVSRPQSKDHPLTGVFLQCIGTIYNRNRDSYH